MSKGIPTRVSICLRGADGKPWYAVAQCELYEVEGVDLAILNAVNDNATLELNPKAWVCADPLTGRQMFFSAEGDSKEEFIQMIRQKCVPEIKSHFKTSFAEAVKKNQLDGLNHGAGPAPHPSQVLAWLTLPIQIVQ